MLSVPAPKRRELAELVREAYGTGGGSACGLCHAMARSLHADELYYCLYQDGCRSFAGELAGLVERPVTALSHDGDGAACCARCGCKAPGLEAAAYCPSCGSAVVVGGSHG